MNEQERNDLEVLHAKVKDRKIRCFDYCTHLMRLPADQLKHCGYKTVEEAVHDAVKRARDEVVKLTKEHIQKYPD